MCSRMLPSSSVCIGSGLAHSGVRVMRNLGQETPHQLLIHDAVARKTARPEEVYRLGQRVVVYLQHSAPRGCVQPQGIHSARPWWVSTAHDVRNAASCVCLLWPCTAWCSYATAFVPTFVSSEMSSAKQTRCLSPLTEYGVLAFIATCRSALCTLRTHAHRTSLTQVFRP